ncbi:MAG: DUF1844 domain-containing protein [candidate division WOR-3 bacterium]
MSESSQPSSAEHQASFSALVYSLSASALAAMGHELPGIPKQEKNLTLARHSISLLEMLKTKTEGNRTPQETSLLEDLLCQLRLAFVAAEKTDAAEKRQERAT